MEGCIIVYKSQRPPCMKHHDNFVCYVSSVNMELFFVCDYVIHVYSS